MVIGNKGEIIVKVASLVLDGLQVLADKLKGGKKNDSAGSSEKK